VLVELLKDAELVAYYVTRTHSQMRASKTAIQPVVGTEIPSYHAVERKLLHNGNKLCLINSFVLILAASNHYNSRHI
jgi:hypothetical protein